MVEECSLWDITVQKMLVSHPIPFPINLVFPVMLCTTLGVVISTSFVEHPITDGLTRIGGLGGENWVVTSPAQVLASVDGYGL